MKKCKIKCFRIGKYSALILLGSVLISACNDNIKEDEESYVKLVKTDQAIEQEAVCEKQFPGVIEEAEELNLSFRVGGPISRIHIREGQYVKKGELLAEIDSRDYQVQKDAIQAQVNQLREEYKRIKELNERKTVADNDYEKMKAGKEMAEVSLKNALDQLRDTKLYAPYQGYITSLLFEEGEMVNIGTPVARIIDLSLIKVEVDVPTPVYLARDRITKSEFTQESIPGKVFPLTLCGTNVKANSNGLFRFYYNHKPETGTQLSPGMNVLVNIYYPISDTSVISVPISAVFNNSEDSYVWVIDNDRVNARKVKLSNSVEDGRVGVIDGLEAGEQVVVGGLNLLKENELVKVIAKPGKTNIGNLI